MDERKEERWILQDFILNRNSSEILDLDFYLCDIFPEERPEREEKKWKRS